MANALANQILSYAKQKSDNDEFVELWKNPKDIEYVAKSYSQSSDTAYDAYVQCGEDWGFLVVGNDAYFVGGPHDEFYKTVRWKKIIDEELSEMRDITDRIDKFLTEATWREVLGRDKKDGPKKDDDYLKKKIAELRSLISKSKLPDNASPATRADFKKQVDGWKERVKKLEDQLKGKKVNEAFKPDDIEGYDIEEAREKLRELVKQFGGRTHKDDEDGVTLWPFKSGDDWEIFVTIEDYHPLMYDITVPIHDNLLRIGSSFSITTDDVDDKMITKIGEMQKRYYDTMQAVEAAAKKMGKVTS